MATDTPRFVRLTQAPDTVCAASLWVDVRAELCDPRCRRVAALHRLIRRCLDPVRHFQRTEAALSEVAESDLPAGRRRLRFQSDLRYEYLRRDINSA